MCYNYLSPRCNINGKTVQFYNAVNIYFTLTYVYTTFILI